jgi:TRAP-type C4-dicarboxylate transport system substrate-binding protein
VNREAFEKPPPATQRILRDTAAASTSWATTAMQHEEDEDTARFGKEGMVLTDPTPAEIKEATDKLRPYWDEWATKHSAEAVAILQEIRTAVGR